MVHFNRLKPCRRDTRLDSRAKQPSSDCTEPAQARNNDVQIPPPIGTNLEIVDFDDDDVNLSDYQSTVETENQNSGNTQDQSNAEMRRYPARERRPPARLQDYIRS